MIFVNLLAPEPPLVTPQKFWLDCPGLLHLLVLKDKFSKLAMDFLILLIVKYFGLKGKLHQLLIKYYVRASACEKNFFCCVRMCVLAQRSTITALEIYNHGVFFEF